MIESIVESLKKDVINIKVKGFIEAPIRWFGIIRVFTVDVPYIVDETIRLSEKLSLPSFITGSPVKVVDTGFTPSLITEGESIDVVVNLYCDVKTTSNIKVIIKKDLAYASMKLHIHIQQ